MTANEVVEGACLASGVTVAAMFGFSFLARAVTALFRAAS